MSIKQGAKSKKPQANTNKQLARSSIPRANITKHWEKTQ